MSSHCRPIWGHLALPKLTHALNTCTCIYCIIQEIKFKQHIKLSAYTGLPVYKQCFHSSHS